MVRKGTNVGGSTTVRARSVVDVDFDVDVPAGAKKPKRPEPTGPEVDLDATEMAMHTKIDDAVGDSAAGMHTKLDDAGGTIDRAVAGKRAASDAVGAAEKGMRAEMDAKPTVKERMREMLTCFDSAGKLKRGPEGARGRLSGMKLGYLALAGLLAGLGIYFGIEAAKWQQCLDAWRAKYAEFVEEDTEWLLSQLKEAAAAAKACPTPAPCACATSLPASALAEGEDCASLGARLCALECAYDELQACDSLMPFGGVLDLVTGMLRSVAKAAVGVAVDVLKAAAGGVGAGLSAALGGSKMLLLAAGAVLLLMLLLKRRR